ncbi:hypothetical protein ALP70_103101, partial [Pseudomonas savastanoi]
PAGTCVATRSRRMDNLCSFNGNPFHPKRPTAWPGPGAIL